MICCCTFQFSIIFSHCHILSISPKTQTALLLNVLIFEGHELTAGTVLWLTLKKFRKLKNQKIIELHRVLIVNNRCMEYRLQYSLNKKPHIIGTKSLLCLCRRLKYDFEDPLRWGVIFLHTTISFPYNPFNLHRWI